MKPVHPIHYNAFSTHGPSYDSTFANLTKEETDLVYSTYGDEVGVQYAESILNYSRNCDFAMLIVDNLLDILTGNEHRKTSQYVWVGLIQYLGHVLKGLLFALGISEKRRCCDARMTCWIKLYR